MSPLSKLTYLFCYRILYSALLEAAYKDKYFTVRYRTVNESEENSTTSYSVKTASHKLALSMFRMLTEDHTFFYHERVGERVLNHRMAMSWKELMRKTFLPGTLVKNRYHFDIVRTKMEVYSQAWEILHQLQGTGPIVSTSSSNSDHGYVNYVYLIHSCMQIYVLGLMFVLALVVAASGHGLLPNHAWRPLTVSVLKDTQVMYCLSFLGYFN